jgi:hypothetical protein
MAIVVVRYADGAQEVALLLDTIQEPTVRAVDTEGQEFVVKLAQCVAATPEQAKLYWELRMQHVNESAISAQIELTRRSQN